MPQRAAEMLPAMLVLQLDPTRKLCSALRTVAGHGIFLGTASKGLWLKTRLLFWWPLVWDEVSQGPQEGAGALGLGGWGAVPAPAPLPPCCLTGYTWVVVSKWVSQAPL